jgi:signal transduction histidine kinase
VSQTRSADAAPAAASAARRTSSQAPEQRNPWVAWLIAVAALPVALALALIGLRVTHAVRSAEAYGQVAQLATLDQQVTGLAQAMADERSSAAAFISSGRQAADLAALQRQYVITDARAAKVHRLVSQDDHGYPAQTRAGAAQVLASIDKLPGLRRETAQGQASAQAVISGYSSAAAGLFPVNNGIADQSGNPTLIYSVRALGSLSRMIDDASQQQAILGVALAEGRFGPGALTALTTARGWQASDLGSFRNSATAQESWALNQTLARPPARQARVIERRAIAAGNGTLALGPQASQQWSAGMSYTVGWMGQAERQLAGWIPADARALQQSEMRSAFITGGVAVGALALVLLGIIPTVRSMARRRRRLEAPALERARAPVPISASAVSAGQETPRPAEPLAMVDVLGAATSEVEEHGRVILDVQEGVYLSGSAATDTEHLLTELLENAIAFSPETAQVIVSGHAVYGGGSLVTITDAGTGMSEEELTLLNWQLANPSLADMTVARHMGLFTVAHLAARHGITVTLTMPPDGGTTAEVYLPDALISLDAEPDSWQPEAGEAVLGGASEEAGASEKAGASEEPAASKKVSPELAHLLFPARRFASGPEPALEPETGTREAVPVLLGAPLPSPAPELIELQPVGAETGDGAPIFESVRSGYVHAFGRDPLRFGEQRADQAPTERPASPPASWGDGSGRAVAGPPTTGRPTSSGLPQRLPPSGPVGSAAVEQKIRQASAAE